MVKKKVKKHRFTEIPNILSKGFCNKHINRWKKSPLGPMELCSTPFDQWGCAKIITLRTMDGWVKVRNDDNDWDVATNGVNDWVGYFNIEDIKMGLEI